jgi:hypothetical protein
MGMNNELMTNEERANSDKLDSYFNDKIEVHITLKRKIKDKNVWLNGQVTSRASERVWVIQERELGEIRLAISEIVNDGVEERR